MNDSNVIQVEIVQGDIEHRLPLADFRDALVKEIGSVALVVSRKQFEKRVATAIDRVVQRVRDEKATAA